MDRPFLLHADAHCVIVDKPPGLPAVPGRPQALQDCAWTRVRAQYPDALVVHRLDMPTSGLLLFARGPTAQRDFSRAFAERRVTKRYVALVQGEPSDDSGTIELPIGRHWVERPKRCVDIEHGQNALTRWRVLARSGRHTRLELEPFTGRTHQLRVHLAAIGHPILGDALYGSAESQAVASRLMLHARELVVPHPEHGAGWAQASEPGF